MSQRNCRATLNIHVKQRAGVIKGELFVAHNNEQ
jgi:hypothetical protein